MESKEGSLDFCLLWQSFKARKKEFVGIVLFSAILALIIAFILPKQYESTTLVQTNNSSKIDISGASAAMAILGVGGGAGSGNNTNTYIELMKSRSVIEPIIAELDLPAEDKELLTVEKFVKQRLDVSTTKQTNLIYVTARGKTPEEAQYISSSVVDNFLSMMTDKNQHNKSLLVNFLEERIVAARDEADRAAEKLKSFSQESKVYIPEEQAKGIIEELAAYDKTLGEITVRETAARANLANIENQLDNQGMAAVKFNMADNEVVQKIRMQIVDQEIELVKLRQRYQEKHPSVIEAKENLEAMNSALEREVQDIVAAETATLNLAHTEILRSKFVAEAEMDVANASIIALQSLKEETANRLSGLSDDMLTYTKLALDSTMKSEVYIQLVKQAEQAKVEQMMQSMDIRIIDEANLPKMPSHPKKLLIVALGVIIGCMIATGRLIVTIKR